MFEIYFKKHLDEEKDSYFHKRSFFGSVLERGKDMSPTYAFLPYVVNIKNKFSFFFN